MIELYDHQKEVLGKLKSGSILWAGTGVGKSITALSYYFEVECSQMSKPKNLLIITTAQKRDKHEWDGECAKFDLNQNPELCYWKVKVKIDSWNNIEKYQFLEGWFVIFDEQRVTGKGPWVDAFLRLARHNRWILLSATPGDKWIEYMPVFIANGFYRNKTDFKRQHVIYSAYVKKYPKIVGYNNVSVLEKHRNDILVGMHYEKRTLHHNTDVPVEYDSELYLKVLKTRWNPYTDEPIQDAAGLCYCLRKVTNNDIRRIEAVKKIMRFHPRVIIFYNFDYELNLLRELPWTTAEWNGHKHEEVPAGDRWAYLVQYNAGSEGWNCITTDTIIFFSRNYSYKMMTQAAGRIDRINTAYRDLYYFYLVSESRIDKAIRKALAEKKDFNEAAFITE